MKNKLPVIFGIKGVSFTSEELAFFKSNPPLGFIIFTRNIESLEQLKNLTNIMREISGDDTMILIDQEGGRVCRLKPPLFRECPSAEYFANLYDEIGEGAFSTLYDNYFAITKDLLDLGINVNCAPVADLHYDYADKIIGDRSFGRDPFMVIKFCETILTAISDAGGIGIIKHIPGHGRARFDSHLTLPYISESLSDLEESDFLVFKSLSKSASIAMTAHIVYEAIDQDNPMTFSKVGINYIRENIGFHGKIITDCLTMKALAGNNYQEKAQNALAAGCDILLHCSGDLAEMREVVAAFV
jgi:beta-N-acetylhexosaminidase